MAFTLVLKRGDKFKFRAFSEKSKTPARQPAG